MLNYLAADILQLLSLQMFTCSHVKTSDRLVMRLSYFSGFTSPDAERLFDRAWLKIESKCSPAASISFLMISVVIETLSEVLIQLCSHS